MIVRVVFFLSLVSYFFLIVPFSSFMQKRPIAVKLGYLPDAGVMKIAVADHRQLFAQFAVVKVLFYYGTIVEKKLQYHIVLPPEYPNMFKTLQTAAKLDPYNMDTYYFAQAAFTWEIGRAREVNDLLTFGMKYRTWDYLLPFFAGFNCSYFLKDFPKAAVYMQRAAELSGEPLYAGLASRFFYESGQNDLGIIFLNAMMQGTKDRKVKKLYALRKQALLAVKKIESAVASFRNATHRSPKDLSEVVSSGFLGAIPPDPYGGKFYISQTGKIKSTSNFAFGGNEVK